MYVCHHSLTVDGSNLNESYSFIMFKLMICLASKKLGPKTISLRKIKKNDIFILQESKLHANRISKSMFALTSFRSS